MRKCEYARIAIFWSKNHATSPSEIEIKTKFSRSFSIEAGGNSI